MRFDADDMNATLVPSLETDAARLALFACSSSHARLASWTDPSVRFFTNTSGRPFSSPATRFVALESKATKPPSAEMAGLLLAPSACMPSWVALTSVVVPATRSRTKMSEAPFTSPGTRFQANDSKATKRPSAVMLG